MFPANQKPFVICTRVTSFALVLQDCTRVTEELHSFLSQSELSNFFVYIINALIFELLSIRKYKTENQINIYLMSIVIGQKSTNQIAQYMSES